MQLSQLADVLEQILKDPQTRWNASGLEVAAAADPHHGITLGQRYNVIRADTTVAWCEWFLAAVLDPIDLKYNHFAESYGAARQYLDGIYHHVPEEERKQLAQSLATLSVARGQARRRSKRKSITYEIRRELVLAAGRRPRCWICGLPFSASLIESFISGKQNDLIQPTPFVDMYMPRLKPSDYGIHVEHVVPVSRGGERQLDDLGNLKLACGWCNGAKSSFMSIYEPSLHLRQIRNRETGEEVSLPQKGWVVRVLATRRACECNQACSSSVDTEFMRVAPRVSSGAPTPLGLLVYCPAHDPIKDKRFVPAAWMKR